jgi:hypothetical protein
MGVLKRSLILWAAFQAILWLIFGITYLLYPAAWGIVVETGEMVSDDTVLGTFLFIIGNNLFLLLLIALGNLFVRFGWITLGPIILIIQGIMIGYIAGSNSFEYPFPSVLAANLQYLKIGLWETTSYALTCAVTMTKSLHIADSFPPKKWIEVRKLKDLGFSKEEKIILIAGILLLVGSAFIEAVSIVLG